MNSRIIVIIASLVIVVIGSYEIYLGYRYYQRRLGQVLALNESPACYRGAKKETKTIGLLERGPKGSESLVLVNYDECFRTGMSVPSQNRHVRIPHSTEMQKLRQVDHVVAMVPLDRGKVVVRGIYSIDKNALKLPTNELAKRLGLKDQAPLVAFLDIVNRVKAEPPVNALSLTVEEAEAAVYSRESPYFSGVTGRGIYIDGGVTPLWGGFPLSTATEQGAVFIDVRSPAEFAVSHQPNAINIPYLEKRFADIGNLATFLPEIGQDEFNLNGLPRDQNALVVFIGESLQDQRAAKAQFLARIKGWKRATYLYGGERARTLQALRPPIDAVAEAKVLDPREAQAMISKHAAVLVDVRSKFETELRSIVGSLKLSDLPESSEISGVLFPDREMSTAELEAARGKIPFAKLATKPGASLIFYGTDDLDWRPLNAARLHAKQEPAQTRFWLRKGLGGWLSHGEAEPRVYLTSGTNSPSK